MLSFSRPRRRVARLVDALALVALLELAAPPAAFAQSQQSGPDRVRLVSLAPARPRPDSAPNVLRLEAQIDYQLDTLPHALLALLLFEDNAADPVPGVTASIEVGHGSGYATLAVEYPPRPGVRALSPFVGLFREDKTLITYVATTPFAVGPWPGRAAFEDGMVARRAGDYVQAVDHLSTAVRLSPNTGNYYYWLADSQLQLGQFDDAVADYTRALELAPDDQASRIGRGVAWLWKREWEHAIDDLSEAIDSGAAPDALLAWAHRARGVAYTAMDRPAEARSDYRTYLTIDTGASDRDEVERLIQGLQ